MILNYRHSLTKTTFHPPRSVPHPITSRNQQPTTQKKCPDPNTIHCIALHHIVMPPSKNNTLHRVASHSIAFFHLAWHTDVDLYWQIWRDTWYDMRMWTLYERSMWHTVIWSTRYNMCCETNGIHVADVYCSASWNMGAASSNNVAADIYLFIDVGYYGYYALVSLWGIAG